MDILGEYAMKPPDQQNAIDVFDGEWVTKLPGDFRSGNMGLLDDSRIHRLIRAAGGLAGKHVLELGPFEAAHTAMMLEAGAAEIIAVEANCRAYLRCLIVKEILGLTHARFLLGDFNQMPLRENEFDFILASGVLYHAKNPVRTLERLSRATNLIGIWSHYYSEAEVRAAQGSSFSHEPIVIEHAGITATCFAKSYGDALNSITYCGGGHEYALWMDRDSWFSVIEALGFELDVLIESQNHINGPQFTALARRK